MFRQFQKCIYAYVILTVIASGSILCIPLIGNTIGEEDAVASYGIGGLFWVSLIAGQIMFWIGNSRRRGIEQYLKKNRMKVLRPGHPGIISFFRNKEAVIADVLVIVSVVAIAVFAILGTDNEWMILGSVSLLFLSLNLHCLFNGLNYKYIDFVRKNSKRRE